MASIITIPESLKKKQERDTKLAKEKSEASAKAKTTRRKMRKEWLKRAQKYHEAALAKERSTVQSLREARNNGDYFVPDAPKVAFVIRIRGINAMNPDLRKNLQLLRLRQLHNGVFVKINSASINMLRKVEPYITYGYPSLKTIKQLIYKRGHGKVNRQRFPIQDNAIIEKQLGKFGIVCMEDLINEIATCGPHFKEANNFLWPFKLNAPKGGFAPKRHPFHRGGAWGNREHFINDLVTRMNRTQGQ